MLRLVIVTAFALVVGACAFRVRGGWQPFGLSIGGTTANRLVWSAIMTGIGAVAAWDWRLAALWPAFFAGIVLGWGSYMDLGRGERPDNETLRPIVRLSGLRDGSAAYDAVGLAVRGLVLTVPAGIVLGLCVGGAAWGFAAAGLAMPLAYWLGWKIGGTEPAELIFGGWLAGSLTALAAA